ncbi:MAG: hypothetical protein ACFBSF_13290 [Leptolyngbyaceae cyanobacterium]
MSSLPNCGSDRPDWHPASRKYFIRIFSWPSLQKSQQWASWPDLSGWRWLPNHSGPGIVGGLPMKEVIGTSLLIITAKSAIGFVGYLAQTAMRGPAVELLKQRKQQFGSLISLFC